MNEGGSIVMLILAAIVSGLIVGVLARWLLPGPDPMGWARTILVGIAGSFVGTLVARLFGGTEGVNVVLQWILSIGGAMLILLLYRRVGSRSSSGPASPSR